MHKNNLIIILLGFFLSSCSSSMNAFVQTSNEGIFLQAKKGQSINLHINNPSKINTNLEEKINKKIQNLGLVLDKNDADYEILINIVNLKKFSYAQRLRSSSAKFFFNDFDKIDDIFDMEVENYYIMQVNLQINSKKSSQKTSLLARTTHLGNLDNVKETLEEKIGEQIASFFYF
ncbi:hypothetical protein [Campylobacter insulaenigrae]|uniref:hypothetical protein n=1 Tax=Campylobacter insulaenigrae TaxID=260714 RepID=UPI002152BCC6|nr:hypothetical protein [Campylobacter insulaenigrae]MCR6594788.1 hypothetical protein [Campylobacter insulaenigrae]